MGAGGNPGVRGAGSGDVGRQGQGGGRLVFEVGGDSDVCCRDAKDAVAAGIKAGLGVNAQGGERFAHEIAGVAVVTAQGFGRQAGVAELDGHAPFGSEADEVRPDFSFHEDDEVRVDVVKGAADVGAGVVG
ncbi:hypothetical protein HMPREF9080_00629 [Cardiobacterium valvarum F0432]|uniref:Uncharacterized protein n=1 Tax=Cardiobacterium valvarum F0432 TaxID=797473 RepID=G9ZCZ9_9GAMM|nr:hypothetical protein HMPREF9080_00629 [Cardiobacterium valvarum F0432]